MKRLSKKEFKFWRRCLYENKVAVMLGLKREEAIRFFGLGPTSRGNPLELTGIILAHEILLSADEELRREIDFLKQTVPPQEPIFERKMLMDSGKATAVAGVFQPWLIFVPSLRELPVEDAIRELRSAAKTVIVRSESLKMR